MNIKFSLSFLILICFIPINFPQAQEAPPKKNPVMVVHNKNAFPVPGKSAIGVLKPENKSQFILSNSLLDGLN
jgi:hypothetical protein